MVYFTEIYQKTYKEEKKPLPNSQIELGSFEFSRLDYSMFFMPHILPGKGIKIFSGASLNTK